MCVISTVLVDMQVVAMNYFYSFLKLYIMINLSDRWVAKC